MDLIFHGIATFEIMYRVTFKHALVWENTGDPRVFDAYMKAIGLVIYLKTKERIGIFVDLIFDGIATFEIMYRVTLKRDLVWENTDDTRVFDEYMEAIASRFTQKRRRGSIYLDV